jgi:Cap4 dsDNA endonuclease
MMDMSLIGVRRDIHMNELKEKVLREFGDHGADTLARYFAQIHYTVYWCIRMLRNKEEIEAVIPESGDDLVILQRGTYAFYQVKTRGESRGPWMIADILPILCQQYYRRNMFPSADCRFHFVSDQMADTKIQKPGALYRLKLLLEIAHSGQLSSDELRELKQFEDALCPKIQEIMLSKHGENIDNATATTFFYNTWIETDSRLLSSLGNVFELNETFEEMLPGIPSYTVKQLGEIYDRLVMMVVNKIIKTSHIAERHIYSIDVISCRSEAVNMSNSDYPDLDKTPGKTRLDKKARLGGFDPTEIPRFHKQKLLAENIRRRYSSLGMDGELEHLANAILDYHGDCRSDVCRVNGIDKDPGPRILSMLKPKLALLAERHFPSVKDIDDLFCIGLLWKQTEDCYAWWHALDSSA